MYCVIQKVINKNSNSCGASKELEALQYDWTIGDMPKKWHYKYTGEKFERLIKDAYKISIHKSYRENGKPKKKQCVICTMGYYEFIDSWPGDHVIYSQLENKLVEMGITEKQLWDLVYIKLQPIIDAVTAEFQKTEEYKVHKKHKKITDKYLKDKSEFEKKYVDDTYDYCYDVFGVLRNETYLKELEANYKAQQEYYKSSYYENNQSNYKYSDFSGYSSLKQSTYTADEKDKFKKVYRALAAKFHPDVSKDDGEMMKFVNKLKEEWGI